MFIRQSSGQRPTIAAHLCYGLLVGFSIHAGAEPEQTSQRSLALGLPAGGVLYTDAGYTDYVASGNQQQTARKKNSKRPHHPAQAYLLQYFRKVIETCFSQLTARFPKQIHAVTAAGFTLKIALFVFAHALHLAGLQPGNFGSRNWCGPLFGR